MSPRITTLPCSSRGYSGSVPLCVIAKKGKAPVLYNLRNIPQKSMGSGGIAPPFLTSALDGLEWSASRPGRFTPSRKAAGTQWIGGWMGTEIRLDTVK
jgi:hypothetical protein